MTDPRTPTPVTYWALSDETHTTLTTRERVRQYQACHPKPKHTPDPARAQENISRDPRASKRSKSRK